MGWLEQVVVMEKVDSTMVEARKRAEAGAPNGTCVVAREQQQGRGRLGRQWQSPGRAGVYLTAIVRAPRPPTQWTVAPLIAGIAVCEAARTLSVDAQVKWPNDVVVHAAGQLKKLAGVLVEAQMQSAPPYFLVGVGVNVALRRAVRAGLPDDVAHRYIGLLDIAPSDAALMDVICDVQNVVIRALEAAFTTWFTEGFAPFLAAWQRLDALRGARISAEVVDEGVLTGTADGIDSQGHLRLQVEGGVRLVQAGEVTLTQSFGGFTQGL